MQTLDDFWSVFNSLQRRTPSQSPGPGNLSYFWSNHPEKDKTVMARYDQMGGQAEPMGGEVGRTTSGYGTSPTFPDQSPQSIAINRLPIKMRQKYLALMGPVSPDSYASQR